MSRAQDSDGEAGNPPNKDFIQASLLNAMGATSSPTITSGTPQLGQDGLWRVRKDGPLSIPDDAIAMERRPLISAHLNEPRHHGVEATAQRMFLFCVPKRMLGHIAEFVQRCPILSSAGSIEQFKRVQFIAACKGVESK